MACSAHLDASNALLSVPSEDFLVTVVVQRSFIIRRGAFEEFEQLSRDGIWPYMEARGCKIVGFFTNMHGGASNEVVLNTAYASMAHWESTREGAKLPADADEMLAPCTPPTWKRWIPGALSQRSRAPACSGSRPNGWTTA